MVYGRATSYGVSARWARLTIVVRHVIRARWHGFSFHAKKTLGLMSRGACRYTKLRYSGTWQTMNTMSVNLMQKAAWTLLGLNSTILETRSLNNMSDVDYNNQYYYHAQVYALSINCFLNVIYWEKTQPLLSDSTEWIRATWIRSINIRANFKIRQVFPELKNKKKCWQWKSNVVKRG